MGYAGGDRASVMEHRRCRPRDRRTSAERRLSNYTGEVARSLSGRSIAHSA